MHCTLSCPAGRGSARACTHSQYYTADSTHRHCSLPTSAAALQPQAKNDFGLSCGLWPLKGRSLWPKTISYPCWIQWYTICLNLTCRSQKHWGTKLGQRGFYSDSDYRILNFFDLKYLKNTTVKILQYAESLIHIYTYNISNLMALDIFQVSCRYVLQ